MKYDWIVPVAKAAGIAALGALGMVGVQNTVPAVKQVTVGETNLSKQDMVEIIQEVRNLPPAPIQVINEIVRK